MQHQGQIFVTQRITLFLLVVTLQPQKQSGMSILATQQVVTWTSLVRLEIQIIVRKSTKPPMLFSLAYLNPIRLVLLPLQLQSIQEYLLPLKFHLTKTTDHRLLLPLAEQAHNSYWSSWHPRKYQVPFMLGHRQTLWFLCNWLEGLICKSLVCLSSNSVVHRWLRQMGLENHHSY